MVDGIQEDELISKAPSTADQIFATSSSQTSDPFDSVPPNWSRVEPKSSMRLAEYLVETTKGSYNVIVFKNIGGTKTKILNDGLINLAGSVFQNSRSTLKVWTSVKASLPLFKHQEHLMVAWDKVSPWVGLDCLASLLIQIAMYTILKPLQALI